ncbi:bifunctional folylpolyglutamate synthase/dihydrofolate synthase [Syntrophomonas erecta]
MSRLSVFGSKPGLERISILLEALGNPHEDLRCVHIAGTNGKGSTSLMIASVLSQAGYRVGRFISPHVHSYFERFTINNEEIDGEQFLHYLDHLDAVAQNLTKQGIEHPTEFEILTALAFLFFRDNDVDLAIIETGLGGLYDSTNVVHPLVSVITSVDYDHTNVLGSTLEEIAFNKAGIIKPGAPVVVGQIPEEAYRVVLEQARQKGVSVFDDAKIEINRYGSPGPYGQKVNIRMPGHSLTGIELSLLGDYQLDNLAVAMGALTILASEGFAFSDRDTELALNDLHIKGRTEIINWHPLSVLDVAHNPHAARALAQSLGNLFPGRGKVLVCGIVDDKDAYHTLEPLGSGTHVCIVTRPQGSRGSAWQRVTKTWRQLFPDIQVYEEEDIQAAVAKGISLLNGDDYLLVTGSFYVLDQARRYFTGA